MRLKDKVAIVTGGANGIGKKTVETFLKEGASVLFTDIDNSAEKTLNEFQRKYENVAFMVHDVQKEEDWKRVIQETQNTFGRIDILFNNAGIYKTGPISEYTVDEWNQLMNINVTGVFLGIKYILPIMEKQRSGSIINTSSIAGLIGAPLHSLYGASKGAVRIMSKNVAMEVAEHNIRVNSIHPGYIDTSMGEDLASTVNLSLQQLGRKVPLQRMGTSQDVANMVLFLASDESSYVTGAEMVVDGGVTTNKSR